jgi:hypothetical protein
LGLPHDPAAGLNGPVAAGERGPVRALLDTGQRDSALTRALQTIMGPPASTVAAMRRNAPLWAQYRALLPFWIRELASFDDFSPSKMVAEFARIRGRTTILLGDPSGPLLTGIAGTWVRRQPGLTVLPRHGQGHTAYLDAPAYLAERIRTALGRSTAE